MYRLSLTIDGDISIEAFQEAISHFIGMLHEVDKSISGAPSVRWRLVGLRQESPATVTCVGEPRRRKRTVSDSSVMIGEAIISGVELLEHGRGRPDQFNDEALETAKRLVHLKARRRVNRLAITGEDGDTPRRRSRTLEVTERVAASVDELIGPKYTTPGSVEGILQAINSHGVLYFNVFDSIWGNRVRCDIAQDLKSQALKVFDQRVLVAGLVSRDAGGRPRHVKVETIKELPQPEELPQSLRGIAPDYTGELDSSEYLKKRWANND